MSKLAVKTCCIGLLALSSVCSAHAADGDASGVEVPPESQLMAPGAAPMPDFSTPANLSYKARMEANKLPAVPMNTTNAKSGVQTPPEDMTSVFISAPSVVAGSAPVEGAWRAFVSQWFDIKKPGYLGNLLSTSQQSDIANLDAERTKLDDRLSDATARGVMAQPLQEQLRKESTSISALESNLIKNDALSYEEATDILFRLNMLKASLDAASHGRTKPLLSDYFNDKDPVSYRDHLLRKLYYFRLNGHLSDSEYDEFRADVNRVSESLTKVGQQADGAGILADFKKIDASISTMADDSPAATNAQHFGKKL